MKLKDLRLDELSEEQSKTSRVYQIEKDIHAVLKQCEIDVRDEIDKSLDGWSSSYKASKWCSIKVSNNGDEGLKVMFQVDRLDNGLRVPRSDSVELERYARETDKVLEEYIKSIRKCFKEHAGKALRLTKIKKFPCRYEQVALNGLYRFVSRQEAHVKNDGHQEFATNLDDLESREMD